MNIGRTFIILGLVLIFVGILIIFGAKIPGIGKLPGDIMIKKDNFTFYFPLTTCILISLLITLFFWIKNKF